MLKTRLLSTILAISVAAAPLAMAQNAPPQHYNNAEPNQNHQEQGPGQDHSQNHQPSPYHAESGNPYHGGPGYNEHQQPPPHYADQNHGWHQGQRYTIDESHRHYVHNWQDYHLHEPPQGYEWVQDDNQFVLIALTTGLIASVVLFSH